MRQAGSGGAAAAAADAPGRGAPRADVGARAAAAVKHYWGFEGLRPLQEEAIVAAVRGRDALVVMPTGGGKSLCFQVPPLLSHDLTVVVSPLISLIKDQVDGLKQRGYPAEGMHSAMSDAERRQVMQAVRQRACRLLYVSPERLMMVHFLSWLENLGVPRFAVDEAHCISHWGHDFRPVYRQLAALRERFPRSALHAFTATATPRVQQDIAEQLHLRDPATLIGRFDRPNLIYRVVPKMDMEAQTLEVVQRHTDGATIIYCISRRETESLAKWLCGRGVKAAAYHAGMEAPQRRRTQEAFAGEELDVVVATVAFGMGIDRSNVRCVLHSSMPKTVEHYQQETGRAGRDGLEAECVLLYSQADAIRWERLIESSAESVEDPQERAEVVAAQKSLLRQMQRVCVGAACRHKSLSEYFGQAYASATCGACDACLGETENLADSTVIAQKILSCVARTGERFGVGHVADVLLGANTEMIRKCRHDQLSTYGLLKEWDKKRLMALVFQLVDQGHLERTAGDRPILQLNDASWQVMRGQLKVRLLEAKKRVRRRTAQGERALDGVDLGLFDALRAWRKAVAQARSVPPYVIAHDSALLEIARRRPTRVEELRGVAGWGDKMVRTLGADVVGCVASHCRTQPPPADPR